MTLRRLLLNAVCFGLLLAPPQLSSAQQIPVSEASTTIALMLPGMRHRTIDLDAQTLFHTLTSDFFLQDDGTVYVQTGDIPAMWLRDSSAQTLPYLRFIRPYPQLQTLVKNVLARNERNILIDSYANAFTAGYKVWEEKWEVDSLAYPILLTWNDWQYCHDRSIFTNRLRWALSHIVQTYECEQQHHRCSRYRSVYLSNHGYGTDYIYTGMIWSAFRPSDDPVRYAYNIPQQLFAARSLEHLANLAEIGYGDSNLAYRARALATAIRLAVQRYGLFYDFRFGWILAYEVDGQGNSELMDDANLPSLLSLRFQQGIAASDPLYLNTRRFSLSPANPYYYRGTYGAGLGSSHTPTGWVWPLGIISAGLTASSPEEVAQSLAELRALDGAKGLFYESVDPNRPWHFTRSEFGWANATYAELIFRSVADLQTVQSVSPLQDVEQPPAQTPLITSRPQSWRAAATVFSSLTRILRD